jgi:hypothetical protein
MNIEKAITEIRNLIEAEDIKAYSPDLPQEGQDICCVTLLSGEPINSLCKCEYTKISFRVLIRGTENDTQTRELVDTIYNKLNMYQNGTSIINIIGKTPTYVGRDENNEILYNILFESLIKEEN